MEILTREGRSSWFPSGVYFSRVNRVSVFSFSAFLLRRQALFAPCFDHFLSDTSSGSAITSHSGCDGRLRMKSGFWEGGAGHTPRDNFLAQHDDAGRALGKACSGCRDEGMMAHSRQGGRSGPGKWEAVCTEGVQPKRTEKLSCSRFPKVSVLSHVMQQWKMFQMGTERGIYRSLNKWIAPRLWEGERSMMTGESYLCKLSGQYVYSWEGGGFGKKWSGWVDVIGKAYANGTEIMCNRQWILLSCPVQAKSCVRTAEV